MPGRQWGTAHIKGLLGTAGPALWDCFIWTGLRRGKHGMRQLPLKFLSFDATNIWILNHAFMAVAITAGWFSWRLHSNSQLQRLDSNTAEGGLTVRRDDPFLKMACKMASLRRQNVIDAHRPSPVAHNTLQIAFHTGTGTLRTPFSIPHAAATECLQGIRSLANLRCSVLPPPAI